MSLQGRTKRPVPGSLGHSQTIYLIKGETAFVLLWLNPFFFKYLHRTARRGIASKGARLETAPHRLHYRLFSLSLYLAHLFNPRIQPVKLPWFPLQELKLRRKYTTQSLYEELRNMMNLSTAWTAHHWWRPVPLGAQGPGGGGCASCGSGRAAGWSSTCSGRTRGPPRWGSLPRRPGPASAPGLSPDGVVGFKYYFNYWRFIWIGTDT